MHRTDGLPDAAIIVIVGQIAGASDEQVIAMFHKLRFKKRLTTTVRGLNRLLSSTQHRNLALAALRRLGLEYGA